MVDLQLVCELDDPNISIARWWMERMQKTNPIEVGEVSDERLEELLAYFGGHKDGE